MLRRPFVKYARRTLVKALCLVAAVALPLGLVFAAPLGEGGSGAFPVHRPRQVQNLDCDLVPLEEDALMLPLPGPFSTGKVRLAWGPIAWTLPLGLPPLCSHSSQGIRLPLYLPVFQRHVLVRVGTHAPPALEA